MSDKEESIRGSKGGPVFPATSKPTKISIAEIAELRKIFEDSKLAKWVVLSGIGGMVGGLAELIRGCVDIAKYLHAKGF
jgi:hypothetical protein